MQYSNSYRRCEYNSYYNIVGLRVNIDITLISQQVLSAFAGPIGNVLGQMTSHRYSYRIFTYIGVHPRVIRLRLLGAPG